jgi:ATP-dependent Clp protease protease subunit
MKKLLAVLLLLPTLAFANLKTITLNDQNTINFNEDFNAMSVAQKQLELFSLAATSQEKDLYIVMYTPGGSVSAGSLFIDTARALGKNIHTITIFSASMGYHTVQGLGKRYILPSGVLMSHRAAVSGLSGQFPGELNERINLLMKSTEELDKIAASRVGLTLNNYKKLIHDELWLTGLDAVKRGHADEVISAKCDASLNGSYYQTFNTFFGPVDVEFSKCPLIVGPIGFKGSNEAVMEVKKNILEDVKKKVEIRL